MRTNAPTTLPATPADWSAAQCAEDLLAQLEELLDVGASPQQLQEALEREGLQADTASSLVAHLRNPQRERLVAASETQLDPNAPCGLDTVAFRLWFRRNGPLTPLMEALAQQGCPDTLAMTVVTELAHAEAAFAAHQRARLRKLGMQAIVAGTGFTVALLALASGPGPRAWWNALPALGTAGLVAYGAVLRKRHQEPHS